MALAVAAVAVMLAGDPTGGPAPEDGRVGVTGAPVPAGDGAAVAGAARCAAPATACVRWRLEVDTGDGTDPPSTIGGDGTVFVRTDPTTLVAAGVGDGRIRWRARVPEQWRPVAVSLDALVLRGPDGGTAVRSASSGRHLWTLPPAPPAAPPPRVATAPPWVLVRSSGRLRAVGSLTGRLVWDVAIPEGGRGLVGSIGAFVLRDGALRSLSADTGTLRWRLPLRAPAVEIAATPEMLVVVAQDGTVTGVQRTRGARRWESVRVLDPLTVLDAVAVPGADLLLLAAVDDDERLPGRLLAFDLHRGTQRWDAELPRPPRLPRSVAADAEVVHVAMSSPSGAGTRAVALALDDGSRRWTRTVPGPRGEVVPAGDAVVVATPEGVTGLDPDDGDITARVELPRPRIVTARPLVVATAEEVLRLELPPRHGRG